MKKSSAIIRISATEAAAQRRRGSRTNWARVDATGAAALAASIAADPDDTHARLDWTHAVEGLPPRKEPLKLRIDSDVVAWFRAGGRGYQTRMNNVLRAFYESRRRAAR